MDQSQNSVCLPPKLADRGGDETAKGGHKDEAPVQYIVCRSIERVEE